ncbi:MAG: lamin tail domain-containing protein [Tannerellaceae bacterium]|nr:lamin tail domain-containing protein [Tannerellaceae bacterium]
MMKCFLLPLILILFPCFRSDLLCAPVPEYPWEGDIAMFETDNSGQIRFASPANQAGEARLRQRAEHASSMSWEIDVKLDFEPTNYNNLRIYVHASGQDTFYIQVGNNESRISLYEKKGNGSPSLHIAGRQAFASDQAGFVSVRLTLEADQTFTLYTRLPGEAELYREGSVEFHSSQEPHEALLDLRFRYVRARTGVFTVRNIKISHGGDLPSDPPDDDEEEDEIIPLEIIETEVRSNREIIFRFNCEVDIADARCVEAETGEVMITGYAGSKQSVAVSLIDPMTQGVTYSFEWLDLRDASGRPAGKPRCALTFNATSDAGDPPSPADRRQVIISEVMANPVGLTHLPATEYVELQNASSVTPISLQGWTFVYDGKPTPIDRPCLMAPGGYAVLFREGREIYVDPGAVSVGLGKFPSALANTGKTLVLLDATGKEIDRFTYPPALAGVSWECLSDGYHPSSDPRGGTPGAPNSTPASGDQTPSLPPGAEINPGDVVFNELLPEPHESGSEYIELHNRAAHPIPLARLSIATRKSDGGLTAYSLEGLNAAIPAGGYSVLTSDRAGVIAFYYTPDPDVIYEHKIPRLANIASSLLLIDAKNGGRIIDEVTYNAKWHSPLVKNKKGVALERIDPNSPTQDPSNWTSASSTAGYGTPGYRNSQHGQITSTETAVVSPPTWIDGACVITYHLDAPGYGCRIHIYNLQGQTVAEISSALMGITGTIPWNGKSSGGVDLRPGVYIFHAELYNPSGKSLRYKKPFIVR